MTVLRAAAAAACLWCTCGSALAQTPAPPPHRFEASAGALWAGGAGAGGGNAELRANARTPSPYRLFAADTQISAAPGFDGRLGYWLTRALVVEGGFVFARPSVRTRITSDVEGAEPLTTEERLDQYFVEASAVYFLHALRLGRQTVPFVSAGGGYLRQLHEGRTLVETGQVYHVGGGLRHWLRAGGRGFIRGAGLRVDVRAYVLSNGFRLEDGSRVHGAVSGGAFLTF